jgi:hypothetical protein
LSHYGNNGDDGISPTALPGASAPKKAKHEAQFELGLGKKKEGEVRKPCTHGVVRDMPESEIRMRVARVVRVERM